MANSCWRPSARTNSRFATFAHAISSTMPIVPISTHSTLPMSPTRSRLNGRRFGPRRPSSNIFTLYPGGAWNLWVAMGSMRATSALARSIVTPGFSRATP